jgi:hypothetical protein
LDNPIEQTRRMRRRRKKRSPVQDAAVRARVNWLARSVAQWFALAMIGTTLFLHFHNVRFPSLLNTEAIDNAQIAINYLKTGELKTRVVYPLALGQARPDTEGRDIYRAPLYPMVLSAFLRLQENNVSDSTIAMANGVLHLLTGWVLFAILRLAYDKRTAIWGVLAFFISTDAISVPLNAQGPALTGLLFCLAVYLALRAATTHPIERRRRAKLKARITHSPWTWIIALAVTCGLTWLAGYAAVLMFVPIAYVAVTRIPNPRTGLYVIAAVGLMTVAPWLIRNYILLHHLLSPMSQYELVMHTPSYLARGILWRIADKPANPLAWALMHPGQMLYKATQGMTVVLAALPTRTNTYLFAFALVGLFVLPKTELQARLWRLVAYAIVIQSVTMCFYDIDAAALSVFSGIITALAIAAVIQIMYERLEPGLWRRWAGLAFIGMMVFPYVTSVWLGGKVAEDASLRSIAMLAVKVPPQAVLASDLAWHVAWNAERRCVLLPADQTELNGLSALGFPTDFIFLSRRLRGPVIEKGRGYWYAVFSGHIDPRTLGKAYRLADDEIVISTPYSETLPQRQPPPSGELGIRRAPPQKSDEEEQQ